MDYDQQSVYRTDRQAAASEVGVDLPLGHFRAATHFITNETAKKGYIKAFEALDKPTKEFV